MTREELDAAFEQINERLDRELRVMKAMQNATSRLVLKMRDELNCALYPGVYPTQVNTDDEN